MEFLRRIGKAYKRRWDHFPARRDSARRGYSRLDGKIDPFISLPPGSLLVLGCIAREPVGIRTGSTDLGPCFFFLLSREAARGGSPLRAIAPGFLVSLALSLFLSLFSFFLCSACPCSFSSRFYPPPLLPCPALLPISALFLIRLRLSDKYPVPSITCTSFYRPPVLRNGYVYTGCPVVRALNVATTMNFFAIDSYDARLAKKNYLTLFFNFLYRIPWRQNSFFLNTM